MNESSSENKKRKSRKILIFDLRISSQIKMYLLSNFREGVINDGYKEDDFWASNMTTKMTTKIISSSYPIAKTEVPDYVAMDTKQKKRKDSFVDLLIGAIFPIYNVQKDIARICDVSSTDTERISNDDKKKVQCYGPKGFPSQLAEECLIETLCPLYGSQKDFLRCCYNSDLSPSVESLKNAKEVQRKGVERPTDGSMRLITDHMKVNVKGITKIVNL